MHIDILLSYSIPIYSLQVIDILVMCVAPCLICMCHMKVDPSWERELITCSYIHDQQAWNSTLLFMQIDIVFSYSVPIYSLQVAPVGIPIYSLQVVEIH